MIIDTHIHIGGKPLFDMQESTVINLMNKYGIEKAIISNADSSECDFSQVMLPEQFQTSQYDSNVRALNFARNNPKRIYVAVWVKPHSERINQTFLDLITRNKDIIKAVKIHPYHSKVYFNSPEVIEYVEMAESFSIPVYTHTATDDYSNPESVAKVASQYPNVKFILAHLNLGSDNRSAIELCAKNYNLYADTAWVPMQSAIDFINKCGSERILFGSDAPIDGEDTYLCNKSGNRSIYQDYFHELQKYISCDAYENLMHKNAERLFGL